MQGSIADQAHTLIGHFDGLGAHLAAATLPGAAHLLVCVWTVTRAFPRMIHLCRTTQILICRLQGIAWTRHLCEDHKDQQQHPSPWTDHPFFLSSVGAMSTLALIMASATPADTVPGSSPSAMKN